MTTMSLYDKPAGSQVNECAMDTRYGVPVSMPRARLSESNHERGKDAL